MIALDLDGTLFSKFGTLSSYAADVLRQVRKKGILVVISSGRPLYSIQREIPEDCYDYASCQNGHEIYDRIHDRHIVHRNLNPEEIRYLSKDLNRYRMRMGCSLKNGFQYFVSADFFHYFHILDNLSAFHHFLHHQKYWPTPMHTDTTLLMKEPIAKMCYQGSSRVLKRYLSSVDQSRFSCFFVSSHWLEIQVKGTSKGDAYREIQQMTGIDSKECACAGDGENDLPMFAVSGLSIAPDNAMPSVKKKADLIIGKNDEDAVAHWMDENLVRAQMKS